MMISVNTREKTLKVVNSTLADLTLNCRIGCGGTTDASFGREGDEKTPLGNYMLRFGLYRADRLPKPRSSLNFWPIRKNDGWCDDSESSAYNRFIRLPYNKSHERLWREDGAYDIILVMSHNDSPPKPGLGSAVFLHVAQTDNRQTLGCIAITPDGFSSLLPRLKADMPIRVSDCWS